MQCAHKLEAYPFGSLAIISVFSSTSAILNGVSSKSTVPAGG
jgi:hypothetical protein